MSTVQQDVAGDPADVDGVVHAVQAAQKGRFAAARGADHGDHLVAPMSRETSIDGVLVAVVDIDVPAGMRGFPQTVPTVLRSSRLTRFFGAAPSRPLPSLGLAAFNIPYPAFVHAIIALDCKPGAAGYSVTVLMGPGDVGFAWVGG
jgi:hypothetical protein